MLLLPHAASSPASSFASPQPHVAREARSWTLGTRRPVDGEKSWRAKSSVWMRSFPHSCTTLPLPALHWSLLELSILKVLTPVGFVSTIWYKISFLEHLSNTFSM